MGRPQRMYSERGMYFVTARTFQARMLLAPRPGINDVIGGALARAVALTGVELHGYVVASNHVHLLVTARGASLSKFMQQFLGNVARKVGRLTQWTGSLWQRRFSAEAVLDDTAALGRLHYILAHGVKEGLVRHPADWPGLSCLGLLLHGGTETHQFFHWSRRWRKGVLQKGADQLLDPRWAEQVALAVTPLPCWAGLTQPQRRAQVESMVERVVTEGIAAHATVLGAAAVASQHPQRRPTRSKRSPRPLCHASTQEARLKYRAAVAAWRTEYSAASALFRRGAWGVQFPPWAFRPSVPVEGDLEAARA